MTMMAGLALFGIENFEGLCPSVHDDEGSGRDREER